MKEVFVDKKIPKIKLIWLIKVYELEKREKDEKMTAMLMFAVEALKIKYKPGYNIRHQKKKKKKSIKLLVEDFSWDFLVEFEIIFPGKWWNDNMIYFSEKFYFKY